MLCPACVSHQSPEQSCGSPQNPRADASAAEIPLLTACAKEIHRPDGVPAGRPDLPLLPDSASAIACTSRSALNCRKNPTVTAAITGAASSVGQTFGSARAPPIA